MRPGCFIMHATGKQVWHEDSTVLSPHRPPPSPQIAVMQAASLHQHSCPHHHGLSDNCHYCTAQIPREPKQFTGDNPLIKLCPHISIALTFSAKRFHLPHVLELQTTARDPFTGLWPVHDGPCTGLKLCCHHLKILNTFFNKGPCIFILHWDRQIMQLLLRMLWDVLSVWQCYWRNLRPERWGSW